MKSLKSLGTPSAAPGLKGLTWLEPSMALPGCDQECPWPLHLFMASWLSPLPKASCCFWKTSQSVRTAPGDLFCGLCSCCPWLPTGCCCTHDALALLMSLDAGNDRIQCLGSADGEMPRMLASEKMPNVFNIISYVCMYVCMFVCM